MIEIKSFREISIPQNKFQMHKYIKFFLSQKKMVGNTQEINAGRLFSLQKVSFMMAVARQRAWQEKAF